jgi:hypothetical protein
MAVDMEKMLVNGDREERRHCQDERRAWRIRLPGRTFPAVIGHQIALSCSAIFNASSFDWDP